MSALQTFGAYGASFLAQSQKETMEVTVRAGAVDSAPVAVTGIVLRGALATRATDANRRLDWSLEVHIPMSEYPSAAGVKGAGRPNLKADSVSVAVRYGDATRTSRKVVALLGQQGGMWHLGLE